MAKMAFISFVLVLGTFSLQAEARIDDTDAAYDLFENSRRESTNTDINDRDLDLGCAAKCTSMDPGNAPTCSENKAIEGCLKAGCVWSCQ